MDQNKFQSFLLILLQLSRKKGKPLIVRLLCYAQKRPVCLWTLTTLFTLNQSLWFQHHIFLFWASLFVRVWLSSSGASDSPSTDKSNSHSTISSRCNKSYTRSDSPVPPTCGGPPTLHVKDRVQGFLVSRSMTPQWMSGSNSLSAKSTQTLHLRGQKGSQDKLRHKTKSPGSQ